MLETQLHFLQDLSAYRNAFLDVIAFICRYIDSPFFLTLLLVTIFFTCKRSTFTLFFFGMLSSVILNHSVKEIIALPRPCTIDPTLCLLPATGYSFPSGAAQGSMTLALLLYFRRRTWGSLSFLLFFPLLMGSSRMYLGVHYPTDVLGGFLIGAMFTVVYLFLAKRLHLSPLVWAVIPWSITLFFHDIFTLTLVAILSGFSAAQFLYSHFFTKAIASAHGKFLAILLGALLFCIPPFFIPNAILVFFFFFLTIGITYGTEKICAVYSGL